MGLQIYAITPIPGFIEVTEEKSYSKVLVNVNKIQRVWDDENAAVIWFEFQEDNAVSADFIRCNETYEDVVDKIREAIRQNGI